MPSRSVTLTYLAELAGVSRKTVVENVKLLIPLVASLEEVGGQTERGRRYETSLRALAEVIGDLSGE